MRKIFERFSGNGFPQFAIKRVILGNGDERIYPMVKMPGLFQHWSLITKVNEKYFNIEIDSDHVYTKEECDQFIAGYKSQLKQANDKKIVNIIIEEVV